MTTSAQLQTFGFGRFNPERIGASLLALALFGLAGCENRSHLPQTKTPQTATRVKHLSVPQDDLAANGLETIWSVQVLQGPLDSAYVVGDTLFVVARPKPPERPKFELIAYNRKDGLPRWISQMDFRLKHAPTAYRFPPGTREPDGSLRSDEIYIVQRDQVVCLDDSNGLPLWKTDLGQSISSGVVASEHHFFVGSFDGKIYGHRKKKEFDDWFYITQGGDVRATGLVDDLYVYFSSTDGNAYRFHVSKGPRYDTFSSNGVFRTGAPVHGAPLVHSGHVYVGSTDFKLYCLLGTDLSERWSFQAQAPIEQPPLVVDFALDTGTLTSLFCVSTDHRGTVDRSTLWAVKAFTGERIWKAPDVSNVVAAGKKTVYALSDSKKRGSQKLLALDARDGKPRYSLNVDAFHLFPSSVERPDAKTNDRAIIFLVHRSGFIQAIGEQF